MAKKEKQPFHMTYDLRASEARYGETLDKPAYQPLVPYKGYEFYLYGGEFCKLFSVNLAEVYDAGALQEAVKLGFIPRYGESLRAQLVRAREEGRVPAHLPHVTPAEWRALFTQRQMPVKRMLLALQGYVDWKRGKRTAYVVELANMLVAGAGKVNTPEVRAFVPEASRAEAADAEELRAMTAEFGPTPKTGTEG